MKLLIGYSKMSGLESTRLAWLLMLILCAKTFFMPLESPFNGAPWISEDFNGNKNALSIVTLSFTHRLLTRILSLQSIPSSKCKENENGTAANVVDWLCWQWSHKSIWKENAFWLIQRSWKELWNYQFWRLVIPITWCAPGCFKLVPNSYDTAAV